GRRTVERRHRHARRLERAAVRRGAHARPHARARGGRRKPERLGVPDRRRHAGAPRRGRRRPPALHGRRRCRAPARQRLEPPDGRALDVANGKGAGSGANPDAKYLGTATAGSASIVPAPEGTTLVRYTREVYALSPYPSARLRGVAPDRLTARPPVRHVVYIIRENRTYDQVLGDLPQGNGDPHLAIFNDSITPNAHAIARRFVLFDNFYVDC